MPNGLRCKLSKLRFQGKITQDEYKELIEKLEGHDEVLVAQSKWQTSWIPCSERLPEENGNYLVTVEANDGTASIKFQMVDHYGPKWLHEGKHEKVIAWMPLPEPYQSND